MVTIVSLPWFWGMIGLCAGSFLTAVIERVPAGRSIARPRSACQRCGRQLAIRDLVPVISWLLLGGRCRWCHRPISTVYPLVEVLTGLGWGYAFKRFGLSPAFALAAMVVSLLLAIAVIELQTRSIPDRLLLGGALVCVPLALGAGVISWRSGLLGFFVCGGLALIASWQPKSGARRDDCKLSALIGLMLGWKLGLLACLVAGVSVVILGLALPGLFRPRGRPVHTGIFLTGGAVISLFWGHALLSLVVT